MDNNLDHKTNSNKFRKIQVILGMFSDYNAIKLEISNIMILVKSFKIWGKNNTPLKKPLVKQEIKAEFILN